MLRAIIIDDESNNREKLRNSVTKHCSEVQIVGEADGVRTGISAIRQLLPDLIFLDIKMDDGSGFDLLNRFDSIEFKVIFVTAYEEYAVRAFRMSAVDYLLKPVDPEELVEAVKRAREQIELNIKSQLDALKNNLHTEQSKKIVLKEADNIHLINIEDIIHCKSDSNYTIFYFPGNKRIMVSRQLKDYEDMLDAFGFFRAHKSHLVNLEQIVRFEKADGGFLVMSDDSRVPVASRKRERLMELFERL
jgi:two-component system LytT family response regulator